MRLFASLTRERLYGLLFFILSCYAVFLFFNLESVHLPLGEDQAIENIEALACFLGAYWCLQIYFLRKKILSQRAYGFLLASLIFLFVGGEEVSWGQRLWLLKPVIAVQDLNFQRELTLHNFKNIGSRIVIFGFSFVVLMGAVVPLLTYCIPAVRKWVVSLRLPLMPYSVAIAMWMGLLLMVLPWHLNLEGVGPLIVWDSDFKRQEFREFYFYVVLSAYVFADYFYLYKFGIPFETGRRADGQNRPAPWKFWEDIRLLFGPAKPLILAGLAFYFIALPSLREWKALRTREDHAALASDARLYIHQGEKNLEANNSRYWISPGRGNFNGRFLSLYTKTPPSEGYYSFKYTFPVKEEGRYKIFAAGSPPGPEAIGGAKNYSPYDVIVDGSLELPISEERKNRELKRIFRNVFFTNFTYASGLAFTKIGDFYFLPGDHSIEFRVSKMEPFEGWYAFQLDAFFVVPDGWRPRHALETLPDDVFSY